MAILYTRYRPSPVRIAVGELPDHKFGYNKRRDTAAPNGVACTYRPECTCGWKDSATDPPYYVYRQAYRRWQGHMNEVVKQQRLAV